MYLLHKEICNIIQDRDDLTFKKVAEYIEASKQCMSKFKSKGVIGFRKLLRLSYLLFPSSQKEVMSNWCLRLISIENIKQSFEYAAITRNIELLNNLILKHKKEEGTIGEYVSFYSIIYKYMIDEISGFDLISNIKKINHPKDEALIVLIEILKCYNYYFDRNIPLMLAVAKEAEKALYNLGDNNLFLKECFLHRIAEILGLVYLFLNNHKLARHYAFIIINADICPKTVSDASYIVGMTYLIEDKSKCIEHLQESYEISIKVGDEEIIKESRLNLDFAKLFLDVRLDSDANVAFLDFQTRKDDESIAKVMEVLSKQRDDDLLVLFEIYSSSDVDRLYDGFEMFFGQTNYYYASIIAKKLYSIGENSFKRLIDFKIGKEGDGKFEENFIGCFNSYNFINRGDCA